MKTRAALAAAIPSAMVLALALAGCSSTSEEAGPQSESSSVATSAPEPGVTAAETASENQQLVSTFVDALDSLGIEHSEPVREKAALLSKASYDLTVSGYDASIQIFANQDTQNSWVDASETLGGVSVFVDGAALSLNSKDGISNSVEIAPRIAEKVGGTAQGV